MKCLSRSTLGVCIGAINILGFTLTGIYVIVILCQFNSLTEGEKSQHQEILSTSITLLYVVLVVALVACILSALLIVGIIKRRHSLMKPWLYTAIAGIACHIVRMSAAFIIGLATDVTFGTTLANLAYGTLTLILQAVIFYPIYTLYKDLARSSILNEPEHAGLNVHDDNHRPSYSDSPTSYSELEKNGQLR